MKVEPACPIEYEVYSFWVNTILEQSKTLTLVILDTLYFLPELIDQAGKHFGCLPDFQAGASSALCIYKIEQ